jgi:hypothetical protein
VLGSESLNQRFGSRKAGVASAAPVFFAPSFRMADVSAEGLKRMLRMIGMIGISFYSFSPTPSELYNSKIIPSERGGPPVGLTTTDPVILINPKHRPAPSSETPVLAHWPIAAFDVYRSRLVPEIRLGVVSLADDDCST